MTRDQILDILSKQGPLTTRELMNRTGHSYDRIHNSVKRLVAAGKVVKQASGAYCLAAQAQTSRPHAPTPTPAPASRKKVNRFILVLDRSGSMGTCANAAMKGFNQTIADVRAESFRSGQETTLSTYQFGEYITPQLKNVPIATASKLEYFSPEERSTRLFDAVERAINDHLVPENPDEDISYVVIVITDGGDNASRDRSGANMRNLINLVQNTDRWTITLQLPPGLKSSFCSRYGVPEGNVIEWVNDDAGAFQAAKQRTQGTQHYFSSRAMGQTRVKDFYVTTDLSHLNPTKLRSTLTNIAPQVKVWEVPSEVDIKPFVEGRSGRPYVSGTAFYALTKQETIQPYKKLLVVEKDKRGVFAGAEARKLLGIPEGVQAKVKPGNHGNYDIYTQSTSVNRKLVRGTKVVFWPGAVL